MPEIRSAEIFNPAHYKKQTPVFSSYRWTEKDPKEDWVDTERFDEHLHLLAKKPKTIKIDLTKTSSIDLPIIFQELANQIEVSKSLVKLPDNWDDEGSIGYKEETFLRAVGFLTKYALWIWNEKRILIDIPKILPAQKGSIDLFWKKRNYDLLINIPAQPNSVATFYGDDRKATKIEGEFPINTYNQGIFLCLLNQE